MAVAYNNRSFLTTGNTMEAEKMVFLRYISALRACVALLIVLSVSKACFALTADEETNIRIYREYGPSVVNITTTTVSYDFFYNPTPEKGSGSGVIIDMHGNIITNYHVVQDARRLEVTLFDGSKYTARLVGTDPSNDLAVIRIDAPREKLKPVVWGDSSDLKVGQKVLAIGNPFGLDRTLTVGIISSLGRTIKAVDGRLIRGIIQTDAAINPGNSGGPLLDNDGRMIGVTTAIFSPVGTNIGLGFAIPVDTVKDVAAQLVEKGYVSRPWLGISGQNVDGSLARVMGLGSEGVLIADVYRGSPAHKAGLRGGERYVRLGNLLLATGGDLILALGGKRVRSLDDLDEALEGFEVGDWVELEILRDGTKRRLRLRLEEMPRR